MPCHGRFGRASDSSKGEVQSQILASHKVGSRRGPIVYKPGPIMTPKTKLERWSAILITTTGFISKPSVAKSSHWIVAVTRSVWKLALMRPQLWRNSLHPYAFQAVPGFQHTSGLRLIRLTNTPTTWLRRNDSLSCRMRSFTEPLPPMFTLRISPKIQRRSKSFEISQKQSRENHVRRQTWKFCFGGVAMEAGYCASSWVGDDGWNGTSQWSTRRTYTTI